MPVRHGVISWPRVGRSLRLALLCLAPFSIAASSQSQERRSLAPVPVSPPSLELRHSIQCPTRLAQDADGNVFVTDTSVGSVFFLDPSLNPSKELQGLGTPLGIAVDPLGRLYVGSREHGSVTVFSGIGCALFQLGRGPGEFGLPTDIVIGPSREVFVADSLGNCINIYDSGGRPTNVIGHGGRQDGEFDFPSCLAIDAARGELYVGDQGNHRIQVFDLNGRFQRSFGGPVERGAFEGRFSCIQSIALEFQPNGPVLVHVADTTQNRIQVLTGYGKYIEIYGETGRSPGQIYLPLDIAWDLDGRVIACNSGNHRVEVIRRM